MILVRIDSAEHLRHQRIREVILFSWCTRWCRPSSKFLGCVLCASYRESVAVSRKLFLYLPSVALLVSLRSKRSRTKRTKFGQRVLVFRIRDARIMGREQKGWRKGVGEGKEGNLLSPPPPPSFHRFALAPFFTRGPNFVRFVRERLLRRLLLVCHHSQCLCCSISSVSNCLSYKLQL